MAKGGFRDVCFAPHFAHSPTDIHFPKAEVLGVHVKARDRRGNKVWAFPPLDEARSAFEQHVGGSIGWCE
ncbi:MAG: hypothetical protein WBA51_00565 [Erythrobacter sp.]